MTFSGGLTQCNAALENTASNGSSNEKSLASARTKDRSGYSWRARSIIDAELSRPVTRAPLSEIACVSCPLPQPRSRIRSPRCAARSATNSRPYSYTRNVLLYKMRHPILGCSWIVVSEVLRPRLLGAGLNSLGNKQPVNEIPGGVARSHRAERPQEVEKLSAILRRDLPERFILEDIQAEVPTFGTVLVQDLGVRDLQTVRSEQCHVILHDVQCHEHALLHRLDEFLVLTLGQPLLLKPIGDGQCPSRLQALRGRSKELFFLRIVRDGFDGPHHVKSLIKFHLLSVHQDKLCAHAFGRRRLPCHFHLYWRNRNPGCFRAVFFSQVNTAAAEPTSNVQDLAAWPEARCACDMLNKLILSRLFGLFATNPIAVMNVRAPQTLVIRACTVVEIPNSLFVVIPIHSSRSRHPGN